MVEVDAGGGVSVVVGGTEVEVGGSLVEGGWLAAGERSQPRARRERENGRK